jgi:hypothetical protein
VPPLIDDLNQAIIFFIKTIDNEGVELGVRKRLSNGCQRVGKSLDLVVVLRGRGVEFLTLTKLTTNGTSTSLGLRRKGTLKDGPCLMRSLGKDNEPGNSRGKRPLNR